MFEILAPFTVGLFGSLHCLGMCGPLVLACSIHCRPATGDGSRLSRLRGVISRQLAFHLGRIATYGIAGAAVAALFESLEFKSFSMQYRSGLVLLSGLFLLAIGLIILKALPVPGFLARLAAPAGAVFGKRFGRMAASTNPASKFVIGLAAGLLPCGLTWAMLVAAAATMAPLKGFLTMVIFGAGTIPLLLAGGVGASFLCAWTRLLGERAAAVSVMIMGALLVYRGGAALFGAVHSLRHSGMMQ
ncbi:MAG: sulfite exporter TauE/SafE family protein [Desulfobacteraceae bacterium]|nr:sulfite exporter TauE/SafE family protein [Desulfobacteraceae bacterium]